MLHCAAWRKNLDVKNGWLADRHDCRLKLGSVHTVGECLHLACVQHCLLNEVLINCTEVEHFFDG